MKSKKHSHSIMKYFIIKLRVKKNKFTESFKYFISGYFECDRENLRNHYKDYDFMNKYFSRI